MCKALSKIELLVFPSTFLWGIWMVLCVSCQSPKSTTDVPSTIDVQGHRGARGLYPENSLVGFIEAVKLGVHTLELDLCVTKDSVLVVSHEPFFSPEFCKDLKGARVAADSMINLYQLTYEEVTKYDCGTLQHPRFPQQAKMLTYKPTLQMVLDSVEAYIIAQKLPPVRYNIELKTTRATDDVFHPAPAVFSDLVYRTISAANLWSRINIQSFDFRTLQYFHETYPSVELALLIENKLPWRTNVDSLGFVPSIYSCYYALLSQQNVEDMQNINMKVIPWTVNEPQDIKRLLDWNVDGIITDYPDRALQIIK